MGKRTNGTHTVENVNRKWVSKLIARRTNCFGRVEYVYIYCLKRKFAQRSVWDLFNLEGRR